MIVCQEHAQSDYIRRNVKKIASFIMLGIINFESLIICLSIDTSFDMIDLQGN